MLRRAERRWQAAWRRPISGASRGRSTWSAARARASGTWTATSTSTSTTASAPWSRATPTRRSGPRSRAARRAAPTSRAATEDAVVVAEELARRFGLPRWRFTNSGTESTMAAIRIARALTGRDDVLKIPAPTTATPTRGWSAAARASRATAAQVHTVHFNDAQAMERRIGAGRRSAAGVRGHGGRDDQRRARAPEPGYLEAVREITRAPRGGPDLRRGQDGADDRAGRRRRALRRAAGHGHAREGTRRRAAHGRDRDDARSWRRWWRTAACTTWAPTTATRSAWRRRARTCSRCSRPRRTSTWSGWASAWPRAATR